MLKLRLFSLESNPILIFCLRIWVFFSETCEGTELTSVNVIVSICDMLNL